MPNQRRLWVPLVALGLLGVSCKFIAQQIVVAYRDAWANGTTRREGRVEEGLQVGEWTFYYENGQRRSRGNYREDRQVGPWTNWYENGVVEWSGSFDDRGHRTGEWTFHYDDETLRARGCYLDDFEDGPWEFFAKDGTLERAGQFDGGKLSGLWTYRVGNRPKAEGLCHRGQRIGPWTIWDDAGKPQAQVFPSKSGVAVVVETWPSGGRRRAGVLADGKLTGRWHSWHENGNTRFVAGFRDGLLHGSFEACGEDGRVLASGVAAVGQVLAGKALQVGELPTAVAPTTWFFGEALASLPPTTLVATYIAEVGHAPEPAVVQAAVENPPPPPPPVAEVVVALDTAPARVPAPLQPDFTVTQREELDGYVLNYLDGPSKARKSRRNYGPPGSPQKTSGPGRRSELEGKPLPIETFFGVDGKNLDLRQYRGQHPVLVVVLRGFVGEVCVYCVAQTEALAQCQQRLAELGIEVVVVYPGAKENQESFIKAYDLTFGKGAPPYRVFYDPDLEFVKALGIAGELAFPSTFVIDREGIVQYAFVGEHRADRPAAKKLIELIEGLQK